MSTEYPLPMYEQHAYNEGNVTVFRRRI